MKQKAARSREVPIGGRAIFNGMSLSHHCSQLCLWEAKEQEQGIQGMTLRGILRLLLLQKLEEHRSGNIGATSPDTSRPTLPMCTSSRPSRQAPDIVQIHSGSNSGREPRPRLMTPIQADPGAAPQLQIEFPDSVTCANQPAPAHHHLAAQPFVLQFSLALPLSAFLMQLSRNPLISIAPNEQSLPPLFWCRGSNCATYCPPRQTQRCCDKAVF